MHGDQFLNVQWQQHMFDAGVTRAFKLWRSRPRRHMHPVLVLGCIARDGCCLHRDIEPFRARGAGDCTVKCECFSAARGYHLGAEDEVHVQRLSRTVTDISTGYAARSALASIFGLAANCYDDPFSGLPGESLPRYEEDRVLEARHQRTKAQEKEGELVLSLVGKGRKRENEVSGGVS